MSKKEILNNVSIEGNKLICPICTGKQFWTRKTLMNTTGMSFFNLDWANKKATNYICTHCGYVYWFMK
ncbi:MAG: hypothetical protein C0599_10025 [Salinivirgaceae bacterium]|nr:MAG: hypothetical protein C0599_10025 [Salinivirgaceae bacterium]